MKLLCLVLALAAAVDVSAVDAQVSSGAQAQPAAASAALLAALRHGGYVLVMRHASSPFTPPTQETADPENTRLERQLDEAGRTAAHDMGAAIKQLGIPIGVVLSSPTYRARQTVQLAALGTPTIVEELDEPARGMQAGADTAQAAYLRKEVGRRPKSGTDTILVTHTPNIAAAFGSSVKDIAPGEALVFQPDGKGGAQLAARIKPADWQQWERARSASRS
ncbi:MAG TPA: histidine phosphatase family protein [Steroidobacteraceae bacterium]|nr:histidine phosphatase family protein [Steroidobacteraceae bacterium]